MIENLEQNNNIIPQKSEPAPAAQPAGQSPADSEDPAECLESILGKINEAHVKENVVVEASLYKEAEDLFKEFTGQNLTEKVKTAAMEEVEDEGAEVFSENDSGSKENIDKEIEAFKFKQQAFATKKSWQILSEEEKKQHLNDINNFTVAAEKKIGELQKNGFDVSKELFFNMVSNGYMFLNIKKSIWSRKIKIPVLLGGGAYKYETMSIGEFETSLLMMQKLLNLIAEQASFNKIEKDLYHIKRRWERRKIRKTKEILKAVIRTIRSEKIQEEEKKEIRKRLEEKIRGKIQKEVEAEERASLEKLSNIGEVGALERLKEFEQLEKKTDKNIRKGILDIQKSLEKDIQERTLEEKKISDIIKKQLEKGKVSKKRSAYLSKITKEEEDKTPNEGAAPREEPVNPVE